MILVENNITAIIVRNTEPNTRAT